MEPLWLPTADWDWGQLFNADSIQAQSLDHWWSAPYSARGYAVGAWNGAKFLDIMKTSTFSGSGTATPNWSISDWGQVLQFTNHSTANFGTGYNLSAPFTITAWIKPSVVDCHADPYIWGMIVNKNPTGGTADPYHLYSISCDNGNPAKIYAQVSTGVAGSSKSVLSVSALQIGIWTLVALMYDGANLYVGFNGRYENSTATTLAVGTSAKNLQWGSQESNATNSFFYGAYFDVRIYTRAVPEAEFWQMWHPETRWELYPRPRRISGGFVPTPPVVAHPRSFAVIVG